MSLNKIKINESTIVSTGVVYDISKATGLTYTNLVDALNNVPTDLREGGMSVKFIQSAPANYRVIKTDGLETEPTGTLPSNVSTITNGTYTAAQLADFSSVALLPSSVNSKTTYYISVTEVIDEQEVTTYTTWVVTMITNDVNKYVQYRLMSGSFNNIVGSWEGVDEEPIRGSNNLVNSSGIEKSIPLQSSVLYPNDLSFGDIRGYLIVEFKDGHIKTKYFDSKENNLRLSNIESQITDPDVKIGDNIILGDLGISDKNGYLIVEFKDGHIKTKYFDSKENNLRLSNVENLISEFPVESGTETTLNLADLNFLDENGYILVSFKDGHIKTKNFDSKEVLENLPTTSEWREEWSKMPRLTQNPLETVRFDGGMARIFKKWGFIGDSLNSGEMYGKRASELTIEEGNPGKEITTSGLIDNQDFITTSIHHILDYQPKLRLIFNDNIGLSNKILIGKVNSETNITSLATGGSSNIYTVSLTSGTDILVSYPSNNKPTILYQNTYVTDMYELSWGQQMTRLLGSVGYNFSVGGEYCKRWCIGADNGRRWLRVRDEEDVRDAYTIALGVNDRGYWMGGNTTVVDYPCVTAYPNQSQYGSLTLTQQEILADVDTTTLNFNNNANSYAGWYAGIIMRVKTKRPDAHIFCITVPSQDINSEWNQVIRVLVDYFRSIYGNNVWCLDLAKYNHITPEMGQNCNLNGHLSAFGYLYFTYQISSYIDWIIRNNIDDFRGSSLIGTNSTADDWHIL